ncbi:MAG: hypothetical protein ABI867_15135 [Kofleriaceae bacterium]
MSRLIVLVLLAFVACNDPKAKAKEAVNKVDKAIDNLDLDEAKAKLTSAKEAIAKGLEAAEECSWAARVADDAAKDAMKEPVKELKRICSFEAPLAHATKAVQNAEKAKQEQPEAPSYTECSSDDWAKAKQQIDSSPNASEARWTDLKTRWGKVCPDHK